MRQNKGPQVEIRKRGNDIVYRIGQAGSGTCSGDRICEDENSSTHIIRGIGAPSNPSGSIGDILSDRTGTAGKMVHYLQPPNRPGRHRSSRSRIDQYLTDLTAYRDDSHLTAWRSHNTDGHIWETFTCLWRGEATTLNGIYQKLQRRGYSQDEYRQAMEDLLKRGWVWQEGEEYCVTVPGREVRQAAEEATDEYFYAPWTCLNQGVTEELRTLLILLLKGLKTNLNFKCRPTQHH